MIAALECTVCQHEYENIQKYEDPNPPCEKCGGEGKRILGGGTRFKLVGGGWAADGYATVTLQQKAFQRRLKDSVSGRYSEKDGKTFRSALRGY